MRLSRFFGLVGIVFGIASVTRAEPETSSKQSSSVLENASSASEEVSASADRDVSAVGGTAQEGRDPMRFLPSFAFEAVGRFVQSGVRIEISPRGELYIARERFESGGEPQGVALPPRLGGGFVFFQPLASSGAPSTALFRADRWTSRLRPLGTVPFAVSEVLAGFDRLYLLGSGLHIGMDPRDGSFLTLAPLPPVVTLQELKFRGGQARVVAPLVGAQQTRDSGLSWHPPSRFLDEEERVESAPSPSGAGALLELLGLTLQQELVLRKAGALDPGAKEEETTSQMAREIVVRGVPHGQEGIVALLRGQLIYLSLDGFVISRREIPELPKEANCQGVRSAPAFKPEGHAENSLFVCQGRETTLFALASGPASSERPEERLASSLQRLARFEHPRRILAVGALGVLIAGPCSSASRSADRAGCLIGKGGKREIQLGSPALKEVFALTADSVLRVQLRGERTIVSDALFGPARRRRYVIPDEEEVSALVGSGQWLPGASAGQGAVVFWSALEERYAGVRLEEEEETLRIGPIQKPLRRALLAGPRALSWGAAGFARITTDGGLTWREVDFPYRSGDPDPNTVTSPNQELVVGCGAAGCSLGTWLSLGWGPVPEETVVETPDRVRIPPPGGGRYVFDCWATGRRSPRATSEKSTGASLPPFWEYRPPALSAGQQGLSVADSEKMVRIYAWGPREIAWGHRGQVQVAFRPAFSLEPLGRSAPSAGLFVDAVRAQEALGLLDGSTQIVHAQIGSLGKVGAVLLRTRQNTDLLTFSRGGPVERFRDLEKLRVRSLSGVVRKEGAWHLGHVSGHEFRIIRLSSEGVSVFAEFPLGDSGSREVQLVQSTAGEMGIAIAGDSGLFVYPVSPEGQLGDPIVTPHQGYRPETCAPGATGFIVVQELSIAPYVESRGHSLDVDRLRLRLIVGHGAPCIDAAAGETHGDFKYLAEERGKSGVPLIVSDLSEEGRRVELACE